MNASEHYVLSRRSDMDATNFNNNKNNNKNNNSNNNPTSPTTALPGQPDTAVGFDARPSATHAASLRG